MPKIDFYESSLPKNTIPAIFNSDALSTIVLTEDYARALGKAAIDFKAKDLPLILITAIDRNMTLYLSN